MFQKMMETETGELFEEKGKHNFCRVIKNKNNDNICGTLMETEVLSRSENVPLGDVN